MSVGVQCTEVSVANYFMQIIKLSRGNKDVNNLFMQIIKLSRGKKDVNNLFGMFLHINHQVSRFRSIQSISSAGQ